MEAMVAGRAIRFKSRGERWLRAAIGEPLGLGLWSHTAAVTAVETEMADFAKPMVPSKLRWALALMTLLVLGAMASARFLGHQDEPGAVGAGADRAHDEVVNDLVATPPPEAVTDTTTN